MSEVRVEFFDTTLRDGAQSLPAANQFREGAKPEIAELIANLHGGVIEAGFPRTPGDEIEVSEVAKTVGNTPYLVQNWQDGQIVDTSYVTPTIAGLCRTREEDIDPAWSAVQYAQRPRIHTFVSTDPEHMAAKFPDKTPKQVLRMGQHAVRYARDIMQDNPLATVEFSAEAASTTDNKYLERVIKTAIDEGADIINLPDTVGQRDPFWMRKFYARAIKWAMQTNPEVAISAHNHNDIDMATVNSLALVFAAADYAAKHDTTVNIQLETTICGLGERAGNADVFPVAEGLFKFSESMPATVNWHFNPARSVATAKRVLSMGGMQVDRQSPIVGEDINTHRSGIHSDGVIKGGHGIYTPHDPTFWGHATDARHEEGRYQGAKGRAAALAA